MLDRIVTFRQEFRHNLLHAQAFLILIIDNQYYPPLPCKSIIYVTQRHLIGRASTLNPIFPTGGNNFFIACDFLKSVSWNKPLTSVIWTSTIKKTSNKLKTKPKPHIPQVEHIKLYHAKMYREGSIPYLQPAGSPALNLGLA